MFHSFVIVFFVVEDVCNASNTHILHTVYIYLSFVMFISFRLYIRSFMSVVYSVIFDVDSQVKHLKYNLNMFINSQYSK